MRKHNQSRNTFGGREVRKVLFVVLVVAFVLGFAGMALAATPTVIGANGASAFTYKDLQDATPKYEGGYAQFNNSLVSTWYADNGSDYGGPASTGLNGFGPHGGYDTTSNKCKVCHAVHRAEGAYYLLRADTQDDACDYCHLGSAHSGKSVYLNGGTTTANGHTIGASTFIPDSTTGMRTTPVLVQSTDSNLDTITDTINVRSYDTTKNAMYRLEPFAHGTAGHPLESGQVTWGRVGPLALRCMNCHQVHDAVAQVWRPKGYSGTNAGNTDANGFLIYGYNLLRRYPSGSVNTTGTSFNSSWLAKVPETALNENVNYSNTQSMDRTYFENDVTSTVPVWVVSAGWMGQGTSLPSPINTTDPRTVSNLTLSVWCGDCHNLNIGGTQEMANVELGFHAHAERTHPAPYAHGGQCYSCHQADIQYYKGTNAQGGPNNATGCSQCHYSQSAYNTDHTNGDFPHSSTSIKLLGNFSYNQPQVGVSYVATTTAVTVTEDNVDAVCIRCHTSIGVHQ